MSESQPRPYGPRGRGSHRGGRGGHRGTRNGTKTHQKSEDQENLRPASPEDQGEVAELKKIFGSKVSSLREVCGGWSDEDLVYALQETDGDVDVAADRISSGNISQWGEVKKKQSKPKETPSSSSEATAGARGGRGRTNFEGRGRGRGVERSRGARGGRATTQTNGTRTTEKSAKPGTDSLADTSAPPAEAAGGSDAGGSQGWDGPPNSDTAAASELTNGSSKETPVPVSAEVAKSQAPPPTSKVSGWAGLFAKPPPAPKKVVTPVPVAQPEEAPPAPAVEENLPSEGLRPPSIGPPLVDDRPTELPEISLPDTPNILTPSKDELTESNVGQLPDSSYPPQSTTAASTTASTQDPLNTSTPAIRPGISGYVASALKATSGSARSASFTRRVMEQHEAVIMPGNHAVDRAAVQFGSMGLNGSSDEIDVDEDREEPETRTQLLDDSPAAPRASLPPSLPETAEPAPTQPAAEVAEAPRPAPGLPPAPQPQQQQQPQQPQSSPPSVSSYADQYRYGQSGQKGFDPFGQQQSQQQPQPQAQSQEPFSNQVPAQTQAIPSSAPTDYSAYYANSREGYPNFYNAYGQTQETQQRTGSAYGTTTQDSQTQYAAASRPQPSYGQQEAQNSGHNTPNPVIPGHQAQHSQHMQQAQGGHGGYPYGYPNAYSQQYPQYGGTYMNQMGHRYGANRPMFDDVRRQDSDYYMTQGNQYSYTHNQQYGTGYNKSSMYGQPQQQFSYEHSSSPANAAGFGQSAMGAREAMYARTGSAQPAETPQSTGNTAFGGMPDPFGRSHSGFGGQTQPLSQQQHGVPQTGSEDPTKVYDATKPSGPSPSVAQAHRPGSAVSSLPGQPQQGGQSSSFPPPQSQHSGQQAFGSYPQYAGLGALGAHHQGQANHHQTTGYGGYGSNTAAFGAAYGGYGSGRGWNGNYGGH